MWFNKIIASLLQSPLHGLMSGSTMLITVTGQKSGRPITVPVNYAQTGNTLRVTSLRSRIWWRNVMDGVPVQVLLRGQQRRGIATALAGLDLAVTQALKAFLAERPSWANQFGVQRNPDGSFNANDVSSCAKERVVIEIELDDEPRQAS